MASLIAPLFFSLLLTATHALPSVRPRSVTTLSSSDVNAFTPYTQFARAAYCDPSITNDWSCGEACDATRGFVPFTSGGDGNSVQFCTPSRMIFR
jgi:hypothetical protein